MNLFSIVILGYLQVKTKICVGISVSSGRKRQSIKRNLKVGVNHSPASNGWSISSKRLVLFSAITLFCLLSPLPAPTFRLLIFSAVGVSCLLASPLSCLTFSLSSPPFSRFACLPRRETRCTRTHWWLTLTISVLVCVTLLSHFLPFCSKVAAYLSRTEILVLVGWAVAAIASSSSLSSGWLVWTFVTPVATVAGVILR